LTSVLRKITRVRFPHASPHQRQSPPAPPKTLYFPPTLILHLPTTHPPTLPPKMGLFTTPPNPPPSHTNPAPSPDGAFEAPNRQSRAHCWEARDTFFACLERNGIVDSIKEKEKAGLACGEEGKGLERECAASWVCFLCVIGKLEGRDVEGMEDGWMVLIAG